MNAAATQLTGFVLHLRPYRESAMLCDLFTRELGRIAVVAHGTRSRKGGPSLLAFNCLALQVAGRGELKTLRKAETLDARWLEGTALAAGLYLNELLVRLLPKEDAHERLFERYAHTLAVLDGPALESALRTFERDLLEDLGYGAALDVDHQGQPVLSAQRYRLEPGHGLVADPAGGLSGATLVAIAAGELDAPEVKRAARRVYQALIAPHLDGRPLRSRELLAGGRRGDAARASNGPVEGSEQARTAEMD